MKKLISTGYTEGFGETFREETPEETFMRESKNVSSKRYSDSTLEFVTNLIDTSVRIKPFANQAEEDLEIEAVRLASEEDKNNH